jgi:hypothetical protein
MTDPIAELIDAATETLRASMQIPAVPEYQGLGKVVSLGVSAW